jgi:hypothetical protein
VSRLSNLDGGCGLLVSSCCARAMRQPCLTRYIPWTGAGPPSASSHISCHSRISIFPESRQSARPLGEVRLLSRLDRPDWLVYSACLAAVALCDAKRNRDCWQDGMEVQQFNKNLSPLITANSKSGQASFSYIPLCLFCLLYTVYSSANFTTWYVRCSQ